MRAARNLQPFFRPGPSTIRESKSLLTHAPSQKKTLDFLFAPPLPQANRYLFAVRQFPPLLPAERAMLTNSRWKGEHITRCILFTRATLRAARGPVWIAGWLMLCGASVSGKLALLFPF
jgi:hypothetical protein